MSAAEMHWPNPNMVVQMSIQESANSAIESLAWLSEMPGVPAGLTCGKKYCAVVAKEINKRYKTILFHGAFIMYLYWISFG